MTIKCAPAVEDRTGESPDTNNYEESWEAVLCEKKEEESKREMVNTSSPPSRPAPSKTERAKIISLIEQRKWEDLIDRIDRRPQTAHVILSNAGPNSSTPTSAVYGNFVLHEAVKYNPPLKLVEALISAHHAALHSKGNWGYLPLHYACTSGASADVVEALLEKYPNAAMEKDSNDHMLPLHLACKAGAEADVLMALLTSYPEATTVKDDFGQTPINYGRNIRSQEVRSDTLSCLEIGKWLRVASTTAKTRATEEFELLLKATKEDHEKNIDSILEEHSDEKAKLLDFIKVHEMNAKDLEGKLATKNEKIEDLAQMIETNTREYKSKVEAERKKLAQTEVALDVKMAELKDITRKLEEANVHSESVNKQLEDSRAQHNAALEEIEALSVRLDNMESLMSSIRQLASQSRRVEGQDRREPAQSNRRYDKFREKALKIGKKAKDVHETNRSPTNNQKKSTNASQNFETNLKLPISERQEQGPMATVE